MDDQNSDQSFLSGTNATFINDLYKEWKINPNAVPKEWDLWFKSNGDEAILDDGPSWAKKNSQVIGAIDTVESVRAVADKSPFPTIPLATARTLSTVSIAPTT